VDELDGSALSSSLQRVGRRRRHRRRSRQSRERSPKTKFSYTSSRVHEQRRFRRHLHSSDPVRAGTPNGDTRVATEFVVLFGEYFIHSIEEAENSKIL
jgi:hypothetical protein